MRSQNIKYNVSSGKVGGASCLSLLLLTFLAVNPFLGTAVYAEEMPEGDEVVASGETEAYAATASTVTISFSPSTASGSVTPIDATNGDKAKVDVQATVSVQNSGGYSVYVGSSSSDLANGANVIPSVTSATTYADLPLNSWGFSFRQASSATDKTVADSYVAMPATLRSTALDSNTSTSITSETRYYMLSFAARIGSDKPAGTYTNSVTMSVVSSPLEVTGLTSLTNMQDMTSEICSSSTTGDSKQLKDTRDGKFYWVSKLADGKCWMTQNLDLDLSTGTKLTSDTSDVPEAGWTPGYTTATTATSSTILADDIGTRSWSLGNYRITNPDASSDCGYPKNSAADCTAQFTSYTTPTTANGDANAHYILGNHYQWNAATVGTGGSITSGTATNSICSKSWRLPTSAEYMALITDNAAKSPFYGVRGGAVNQSADVLFFYAGVTGYYWSSTPYSSSNTYYFIYNSAPRIDNGTAGGTTRRYGFSVRCVAK